MPRRRKGPPGIRFLGRTADGEERWQVRVSTGRHTDRDGKVTYHEVSKVERSLEEAATTRLYLLAETGRRPRGFAEQVTVEQLVRRWLDGRDDLEARTRYDYEGYLRRSIAPSLGDRPIGDVTPMEIEAVYRQWRDKGMSPAYIRLTVVPLKAAFAAASDRWGMIPRNPVAVAKIPTARARKAQFVFPTDEQLASLIASAWDVSPVMQALAVVAAGSGMRRGELCALQWGDVDWAAREIHVRRAIAEVGGELQAKDPKTHADRRVHVPDQVIDVLARWRAHQQATAATDGLEPGPWVASLSGGDHVWPASISKWWAKTCKLAGVTGVRLHDLRHAYATWALGQGMTPLDVARQLGHQSPMMTLTVYGHALTEGQRKVADVIAGRLPTLTPRIAGELEHPGVPLEDIRPIPDLTDDEADAFTRAIEET